MVIRMRHTRAHTANRRSHHALSPVRLSKCSSCGAAKMSHRACSVCGKYKGRVIIDVVKAVAKSQKKKVPANSQETAK